MHPRACQFKTFPGFESISFYEPKMTPGTRWIQSLLARSRSS